MSYTRGLKANQVPKVLDWLKEGETPERIAAHLQCSVETVKSFVGKGKEVIPETVVKMEVPKPATKKAKAKAEAAPEPEVAEVEEQQPEAAAEETDTDEEESTATAATPRRKRGS